MRLIRHFPLVCLLILAACGATPQPSTVPSTPSLSGIPTFEKPIGLLPEKIDAADGPVATVQPAGQELSQPVFTPDLGLQLDIPADWSSKRASDRTLILGPDGRTLIEAGQAFGFASDADAMSSQMGGLMLGEGFGEDGFNVRQSVVSTYNYVIVSGSEVDACQYAYLSVGLSWLALKFDRSLCTADGRLNEVAFAILRSVKYTGPTE